MARAHTLLVIGRSGQLARELAARPPAAFDLVFAGRDRFDLGTDDPGALLDAERPAAVINAAAFTSVDGAEAEGEAALRINAQGPGQLAAACHARRIPLVHISTDYVFDGLKHAPYLETDAPNPLNAYGQSKLDGEQAVLERAAQAAVVRTSWVFGAYGTNFMAQMLRLLDGPETAHIVADQTARPTWARDLAEGVGQLTARLLDGDAEALGLFHLSGADDAVRVEMAEAIFAYARTRGHRTPSIQPVSTSDFVSAARRPLYTSLDCTRIAALGVQARPWRERLALCLDEMGL